MKKVYVYSAVPPNSKETIKEYGLLSGVEVAKNKEILKLARPTKKSRKEFVKKVEEKAASDRPYSVLGPSVLFTLPDESKITDKHFIKEWGLVPVRINLSKLLKDYPETIIWGAELLPIKDKWRKLSDEAFDRKIEQEYGLTWEEFLEAKSHELTLADVRKYSKKSPKSLWKDYEKVHIGKMYAANVPHAFIITPMGTIPYEYIEFIESRQNPNFDFSGTIIERTKKPPAIVWRSQNSPLNLSFRSQFYIYTYDSIQEDMLLNFYGGTSGYNYEFILNKNIKYFNPYNMLKSIDNAILPIWESPDYDFEDVKAIIQYAESGAIELIHEHYGIDWFDLESGAYSDGRCILRMKIKSVKDLSNEGLAILSLYAEYVNKPLEDLLQDFVSFLELQHFGTGLETHVDDKAFYRALQDLGYQGLYEYEYTDCDSPLNFVILDPSIIEYYKLVLPEDIKRYGSLEKAFKNTKLEKLDYLIYKNPVGIDSCRARVIRLKNRLEEDSQGYTDIEVLEEPFYFVHFTNNEQDIIEEGFLGREQELLDTRHSHDFTLSREGHIFAYRLNAKSLEAAYSELEAMYDEAFAEESDEFEFWEQSPFPLYGQSIIIAQAQKGIEAYHSGNQERQCIIPVACIEESQMIIDDSFLESYGVIVY